MNAEFRIRNFGRAGILASLATVRKSMRRQAGMPILTLLALITITFFGCENTPTEVARYDPEPVLSAYLYNGEPVKEVFLERVAPFRPGYDPRNYGIVGGNIRITGGGDTLTLIDDPNFRGRYIPAVGDSLIPRGKVHYRIEATTPSNEFLWAETAVPDTFTILNIFLMDMQGQRFPVGDGDTLSRGDPLMFWEWSGCDSAGGYAGTIIAQTDRDSLVPLDPDWDAATDSVKMEERNRAGYTVMRDDQRRISIAWIFFMWEGPTKIELQAISKSYYDYLYSSFRIGQGMAERPLCNIHGGLGIFSGIARKSMEVYMKRVSG